MRGGIFFTAILGLVLFCGCGERKEEKPSPPSANAESKGETQADPPELIRAGVLEFSPAVQYKKAKVGTEEVEFNFTAVNLGAAPVAITKLDSGCACIKESVHPRVIPPGESARISAVYTTEKLSGLAEKIIMVGTDQPGVRDVFLKVKLEMEPIYLIDHELTTWTKGKKPETKIVNFVVSRNEPIRVLSAASSRSEVTAEVVEVEKGRKYQILLTPKSTEANLLGMVRLTTDCEIEAHSRPLLYVTVQ